MATSASRRTARAAPGSETTPSRLCGPRSLSIITTRPRPMAATYAAATSVRSNQRSSRPLGNARKTWRKSTGGSREAAIPIVYGTSIAYGSARLVQERCERKAAKPAATMSGPNRLSGRHHHAIRPARMYESTIQSTVTARATGSGEPSLANASASVAPAAAQPARPIAQSSESRGARATPNARFDASAEPAISLAPFRPAVAVETDGTSQARPLDRVGAGHG